MPGAAVIFLMAERHAVPAQRLRMLLQRIQGDGRLLGRAGARGLWRLNPPLFQRVCDLP